MSKKMQSELVAILSDLIALPSPYPPGTSVEICAYAAKRLKKAGYKVETVTKAKGVDNVVARMKGKGRGPVIAFNAHVDTVGVGERGNWKSDPYKALVKGGLVYGLGAGNCKGSMAVQLWLAEEIVGHPLWGHVSKTGPRPRYGRLYAMDMPFVETHEEAKHFIKGPVAYQGGLSPWKQPITSYQRPETLTAERNGHAPNGAAGESATSGVPTNATPG